MRRSYLQIVIAYPGHFVRLMCLMFALFISGVLPANAQIASPSIEYQVKASLVFNFLHFVEWPAETLRNGGDQITICLIGPNVYGRALKVLEGEIAQGKRLTVRLHTEGWSSALADNCQVAIFSEQDSSEISKALPILVDKGVLTIGETSEFLKEGGIIKFSIVNETVQFEINYGMAKKARLIISSKLLRLASNVID